MENIVCRSLAIFLIIHWFLIRLMNTQSTLIIFAILAALGLLGVAATETINMSQQQAEASRGCINPNAPGGGSIAFNASKGRCAR